MRGRLTRPYFSAAGSVVGTRRRRWKAPGSHLPPSGLLRSGVAPRDWLPMPRIRVDGMDLPGFTARHGAAMVLVAPPAGADVPSGPALRRSPSCAEPCALLVDRLLLQAGRDGSSGDASQLPRLRKSNPRVSGLEEGQWEKSPRCREPSRRAVAEPGPLSRADAQSSEDQWRLSVEVLESLCGSGLPRTRVPKRVRARLGLGAVSEGEGSRRSVGRCRPVARRCSLMCRYRAGHQGAEPARDHAPDTNFELYGRVACGHAPNTQYL